jgi:hypothetical protein
MRHSRRSFLGSLPALTLAGCVSPLRPVAGPPADGKLRVYTDFPGGSARVIELDHETRTVRLTPSPHPGRGWECWWYFKLTGVRPGETITVEVGGMNFALPDQAHFSPDGRRWQHTARGTREPGKVTYTQRVPGHEAWFAWGPPFQVADARSLVRRAAINCQDATVFTLTKSAEGRLVPALRVAPRRGTARDALWVQARQHAWESGSSWVGQGFTEWLVSGDPRAVALRERAEVFIVPIMDVDNVERGAGGKNQQPQDHNRDWSGSPHWPEVRAAQAKIRELAGQGRFRLFLDLHNPAPNDREPMYFIVPREQLDAPARHNLDQFLAASRAEMTGPLKLSAKTRETGANYDPNWERISKNWVQRNGGPGVVAVTLETSWNTPNSTVAGYEQIGRELGLAVERYLQTRDR